LNAVVVVVVVVERDDEELRVEDKFEAVSLVVVVRKDEFDP
jgi:hypothetical protein